MRAGIFPFPTIVHEDGVSIVSLGVYLWQFVPARLAINVGMESEPDDIETFASVRHGVTVPRRASLDGVRPRSHPR